MSAREQLLQTIGPALAFVQARAASQDLRAIDFDAARRLWIERLSGVREDGSISLISGTLEEGQSPSIARVTQWREGVRDLVRQLKEDPALLGVRLIDYEEE